MNAPESNMAASGGPTIAQGVCHAFFAYDIGFAIDLGEAERVITATKQREMVRHRGRAPASIQYEPPPLRVTYAAEPVEVGGFRSAASVDIVLYDFGAASVAYAFPLSGPLAALLPLSDALYDHAALLADSRKRVEGMLTTLRGAIKQPGVRNFVEDYAVYQIAGFEGGSRIEEVIGAQGPLLARILRSEREALSEQEVADALGCRIAYGAADAALIDWNAAMLLAGDGEDVRTVLEFANVELLEMRYLDQRLDEVLNQSYAVLASRRKAKPFGSYRANLHRVAQMQADSAILFEGVNNALKLLGDQYLARVYRLASQRLHLAEWDTSIIRKLETVDSIYAKLVDQQTTRRMEILEWIIIVLFVVSISVEFIRRH